MSKIQYTSVDRVFSKLYRDLPIKDISEDDVIEWIGEALEASESASSLEEALAFIEVTNHQCKIPTGLKNIIQIGLNTQDKIGQDSFCPKIVAEELTVEPIGPAIPVILDCLGQPTQDVEVAYYRPFFDYKYNYFDFSRSYHNRKYVPIRLSSGGDPNRIVCEHREQINYGEHEYTIIQGKYLRFSFQEGIVALSYNRQELDPDTGYPMIPDDYSSLTAIVKYITMKLMEREFYSNREGSQSRLQKAEQDWQWYCKQAGNKHFIPNGIDEYQNLLEQRSYLLPDNDKYYGFFGSLGRGEDRKYNNPDRRNNSFRLFYGN